jgi:hypothetical protein
MVGRFPANSVYGAETVSASTAFRIGFSPGEVGGLLNKGWNRANTFVALGAALSVLLFAVACGSFLYVALAGFPFSPAVRGAFRRSRWRAGYFNRRCLWWMLAHSVCLGAVYHSIGSQPEPFRQSVLKRLRPYAVGRLTIAFFITAAPAGSSVAILRIIASTSRLSPSDRVLL